MGRLTIDGTIDLAQFWPTGESDADTTKLVVDVRPGAIRYEPPNAAAQATTVFDGAYIRASGAAKPVIKNGRLTVRLQGLDAPELHIQPQSMKGTKYKGRDLGSLRGSGLVKPYRQHQAESATVRLTDYLGTLGPSPLHCQFFTQVNDDEGPGDALDKYGRFVGNILIEGIDLNLEILRQGLAVISLYNSMLRSEMDVCLEAWTIGRTAPGGIVRYMTHTIGVFEATLTYNKPPNVAFRPESSKKFIHPKLFRRYCTWWAYRQARAFTSGFDTFLALSKNDVFYELSDMMNGGVFAARPLPLEMMVRAGKTVQYGPDEVVFKESASRLYSSDGKVIDHW